MIITLMYVITSLGPYTRNYDPKVLLRAWEHM